MRTSFKNFILHGTPIKYKRERIDYTEFEQLVKSSAEDFLNKYHSTSNANIVTNNNIPIRPNLQGVNNTVASYELTPEEQSGKISVEKAIEHIHNFPPLSTDLI